MSVKNNQQRSTTELKGENRRSILRGAVGGILALGGAGHVAAAQPKPKVDICHLGGNGVYKLISVNGNALDAHLAHGDTMPHPLYGCGCMVQEVWVDGSTNLRWTGEPVLVGPFLADDVIDIVATGTVTPTGQQEVGPNGPGTCRVNGHEPDSGGFWCWGALFYSWSDEPQDADVRWLGESAQLVAPADGELRLYVEDDRFASQYDGGFNVKITACAF